MLRQLLGELAVTTKLCEIDHWLTSRPADLLYKT